MPKHVSTLKNDLVRIAATVVAVILVLYLAKLWFFNRPDNSPSQIPANGQTTPSFPQPFQPKDPIQVISWQDAAKHYGENITVEGTIVVTHNSGKACFLNFHPNYKRYFTAVIFASAFPRFPANPENYYSGKKVHVSGSIKEYKGKPEIILNDPSQIEILK
jgi:DNA/RNA endonuclease YhcR with UshA esterase domain